MTSGIEVNSWGSKIPPGMLTEPRGLLLICAVLLGFVGRSIKYLISLTKVNASLTKEKKKRMELGQSDSVFLQYVWIEIFLVMESKYVHTYLKKVLILNRLYFYPMKKQEKLLLLLL